MFLEIFDVEHGACALITTSNGKHVMIDCGHNTTTGWKPGAMLKKRRLSVLDELIVTNYDEDHVSGIKDLLTSVAVGTLRRNTRVSAAQICQLKSEDGMGPGIQTLVYSIQQIFTGGSPVAIEAEFGDTDIMTFSNHAGGLLGFNDENNLSLVVFVTCGSHRIIFPGDMEKAGWKALLENQLFKQYLSGVTLFVASHHGRENGFCNEVMKLCRDIQAVIISDKKMGHQTQETVPSYRAYAKGFMYDGQLRRVLTTRRDGNMTFQFPAQGGAQVLLGVAA